MKIPFLVLANSIPKKYFKTPKFWYDASDNDDGSDIDDDSETENHQGKYHS